MRFENTNNIQAVNPWFFSLRRIQACLEYDSFDGPTHFGYETKTHESVNNTAGNVAMVYKHAQASIHKLLAALGSIDFNEFNTLDRVLKSDPIWEKLKAQIKETNAGRRWMGNSCKRTWSSFFR